MKFGSLGAAVAAIGMSFSVAPVHAEQITIEQFSQVFGDILAVGTICPNLDGTKEAMENFMAENGISKKLMDDHTGYMGDVELAKKASFKRRKSMSVTANCDDALRLYGENGTVIKGLLFKKNASSN